jgi:hypothetical protein
MHSKKIKQATILCFWSSQWWGKGIKLCCIQPFTIGVHRHGHTPSPNHQPANNMMMWQYKWQCKVSCFSFFYFYFNVALSGNHPYEDVKKTSIILRKI